MGEHFALAAVFVAERHQAKRGVVAVGADHAQEFRLGERVTLRADACVHIRLGRLSLDHDAFEVGRGKGRVGRAPRMKTNKIQAVGFFDLEDPPPRRHIAGRMARKGEDLAFQCAPQKQRSPVQGELGAAAGQFPQTKLDLPAGRGILVQFHVQGAKRGMKLIPSRRARQGDAIIGPATLCAPRDVRRDQGVQGFELDLPGSGLSGGIAEVHGHAR